MSRPAASTPRRSARCIPWACVLALVFPVVTAGRAQACETSPASDGTIGVWLLAPSVYTESLDSHMVAVQNRRRSDSRRGLWKGQLPVANRFGEFDLRRLLKSVGYPGNRAVFGGILRVEHGPLDALLLVRADGATVVRAGEDYIWSRHGNQPVANAWDVVPLRVPVGEHRLEIAVQFTTEAPKLSVRLVERATFQPPRSAHWHLPGLSDAGCLALGPELIESTLRWAVVDGELIPELRLAARGGFPRSAVETVNVTVTRGPGVIVAPEREVAAFPSPNHAVGESVLLPPLRHDETWPASLRLRFAVSVRDREFEHFLGSSYDARAALREAHDAEAKLPIDAAGVGQPEGVGLRDTLALVRERLTAALNAMDWSAVVLETERLQHVLAALRAGALPWQSPGIHEVAIRTSVADTPDRVLVHVPASYRDGAHVQLPLVVVLHGFGGSPDGILRAFLDQELHQPRPDVDGFVIAPEAFGNTFYRGAGEGAVLSAIEWALRNYPIDRERVSITGVSMGGTGASHIALRYAERFSALASLCGYESYFVRHDTAGGPRTTWERASMHHWSPASWAGNGTGLGLFVARGTKDKPLAHSRVLVESFIGAGLGVRTEWPEAGHRVWPVVYDGARLWPWLTAFRSDPSPARVVLHTDALRYGKRAWVQIDRLDRTRERASVIAELGANGNLVVQTSGVLALSLSPKAEVASISIDGEILPVSASPPFSVSKVGDDWHLDQRPTREHEAAAGAPRTKRAGTEGPIHDAYLDRLVFAYGTLDSTTRRANREIAEAWARGGPGVRLDRPVVRDTEVTVAMHQQSSLFLVGTERDHSLLQRWRSILPIATSGGTLRVAREHYDFPQSGALFVYPNPEGSHYIVVLTAPTLSGLWRSFSLPKLLPDYIVWDERLRAATGQQLLGTVPVIAAGRFAEDWSLSVPEPTN